MNTILVVGSGGREHALAWKLEQSPSVSKIIVAPGNDGMPAHWERWFDAADLSYDELATRAEIAGVSLAIIGPDHLLAAGIVDVFTDYDIPVFGPTGKAALLEASKSFAKEVMNAAGVPTARYHLVNSVAEATSFFDLVGSVEPGLACSEWVIKADGLALGKGVHVSSSREDALQAVGKLLKISGQVLIEEKLSGEEISWLAFCDGNSCALLDPARDYKRAENGNCGPNTGGMGAFSPVPGIPAGFEERLRKEVFAPVLSEMKKRGTPFRGILYAGLMVDFKADRYWVLEFNARFGDPETQVLLPRLSGDLFAWCMACAQGDLSRLPPSVPFVSDRSVFVLAASPGYPEKPDLGFEIKGELVDGAHFAAGVTRNERGQLETSGGRVFGALGLAEDFESARKQAYSRLAEVKFTGMHFRTDIAEGL